MKKIFSFAFILISVLTIAQPKDNFSLKGSLDGVKKGMVLLYVMENGAKDSLATTKIVDGKFQINSTSFPINEPKNCMAIVYPEAVGGMMSYSKYNLIIDNNPISIIQTAGISGIEVTGSEYHDLVFNLNKSNNDIDLLKSELYKTTKRTEKDSIYKLMWAIEKDVVIDRFEKADDLILKGLLIQAHSTYIDGKDIIAYSEEVINGLGEEHSLSKSVLAIKKAVEQKNKIEIGNKFIDFIAEDKNGGQVKFSEFAKGKYILLDFWASWCGPCKKEFPELKKAYNKLNSKGFDIFAISTDAKKEQWLKELELHDFVYTNTLDVNKVTDLYVITSVPTNFLIDPNGIIVAKNLRGEKVLETLEKFLNENTAAE
jgi:peroxiredoxin